MLMAFAAGLVVGGAFSRTNLVDGDAGAGLKAPTILLAQALEAPAGARDVASNVLRIDGGALITGWTSRGHGQPDGLLLHVDADGNVLARREWGGDGMDLLWNVQPDGAGGWMVLGFTGSSGAGEMDGWVLRLDAELNVLWEKTIGGPGEDWLVSMARVEGGWMAVGQTSSRGAGGLDAQVVKFDDAGKEISTWTWGHAGMDRAFAILPTDDGGCLIGGMSGRSREDCDGFVTRLNAQGREVWVYKPERAGFGVVHDIKRCADGSIAAFGYEVQPGRNNDGFVKQLSADGTLLSESHFGGQTYDRIVHGEVFDDGSSIVAGYTQRPGSVGEEEGWDMVIRSLDAAGSVRWEQRFGGEQTEMGRGISGPRHDVWIVGHTERGDESRVFLVRVDGR